MTGAGLDELRNALVQAAGEVCPRDAGALARLPIDRVFTMKGFGTVVTGTLVSGTIKKEDELEVFPGGKRVRVRGLQVYGQTSEQATAGQRTALNVAGVNKEELARGMQLAPPNVFRSTRRADVSLSALGFCEGETAQPRSRAPARLHFGSRGGLGALQREAVGTGEDPLRAVAPGRFRVVAPRRPFHHSTVLAAVVTIGGGVVLDATPLAKPGTGHQAFLQVLKSRGPDQVLLSRIGRRGQRGLRSRKLSPKQDGSGP